MVSRYMGLVMLTQLYGLCAGGFSHQRRLAPTQRPMPPLRPSRAASTLQERLNADAGIGICYKGTSLWDRFPDSHCQPLTCLWSDTSRRNIDLWFEVFKPLESELLPSRCPAPQGGQTVQNKDEPPEVAFILTMHNHPEATAESLLELFRTAVEVHSSQFILVDDGSTHDVQLAINTGRQLQHLFGTDFRYIRNSHAEGYGAANNIGVAAASATYVLLVNSDAFVVNGWLQPLVATMRSSSNIGMVGPMLMGDNYIVTEAGGMILADGSAFNNFRSKPGDELPHCMNRRFKVDYISTVAALMERDIFLSLGGFDDVYAEGYWEDTDLAMRMRKAGLSIIVQPISVIYHQEGGTFGVDSTNNTKATRKDVLMRKNGDIFFSRWRHVLERQHCPRNIDRAEAMAQQRLMKPSILYVDDIRPQPERDSGSMRTASILSLLLKQGYSITFAAATNVFAYSQPSFAMHMRFMGVEVWPDMAISEWPLTEKDAYQSQCKFDYIVVARWNVAESALPVLRQHCPGVPVIFDTVDIHFMREARHQMVELQREGGDNEISAHDLSAGNVLKWLADENTHAASIRDTRDRELKIVSQAAITWVVSTDDRDIIMHYKPDAHVRIVSNIMPTAAGIPMVCANRNNILFVGSFAHLPNPQALEHFLIDVLPALMQALPPDVLSRLHVHVVGSGTPPETTRRVLLQNSQIVTLHKNLPGHLLDILFAQSKVLIAPLLVGSGVKGKINQALYNGVPVVAYKVAIEGMHLQHGRDVLMAHNATNFAQQVAQLFLDCSLWIHLSQGGLKTTKEHFASNIAENALQGTFEALGQPNLPSAERRCVH